MNRLEELVMKEEELMARRKLDSVTASPSGVARLIDFARDVKVLAGNRNIDILVSLPDRADDGQWAATIHMTWDDSPEPL